MTGGAGGARIADVEEARAVGSGSGRARARDLSRLDGGREINSFRLGGWICARERQTQNLESRLRFRFPPIWHFDDEASSGAPRTHARGCLGWALGLNGPTGDRLQSDARPLSG